MTQDMSDLPAPTFRMTRVQCLPGDVIEHEDKSQELVTLPRNYMVPVRSLSIPPEEQAVAPWGAVCVDAKGVPTNAVEWGPGSVAHAQNQADRLNEYPKDWGPCYVVKLYAAPSSSPSPDVEKALTLLVDRAEYGARSMSGNAAQEAFNLRNVTAAVATLRAALRSPEEAVSEDTAVALDESFAGLRSRASDLLEDELRRVAPYFVLVEVLRDTVRLCDVIRAARLSSRET